MILIGQYDSPFVRRVGIALSTYEISFEHRPWSTFGDAEKMRTHNPLVRVPTLVLDDGTALVESHCILDFLDGQVGERAMFPRAEPERHRALRIAAFAMGVADKAVSLFYEKRLHEVASTTWVDRCRSQIEGALAMLEADRAARTTPFWFGERMGHADVAVAVALRFFSEAHPGLVALDAYPALASHSKKHEALPVFERIYQPFLPPVA